MGEQTYAVCRMHGAKWIALSGAGCIECMDIAEEMQLADILKERDEALEAEKKEIALCIDQQEKVRVLTKQLENVRHFLTTWPEIDFEDDTWQEVCDGKR